MTEELHPELAKTVKKSINTKIIHHKYYIGFINETSNSYDEIIRYANQSYKIIKKEVEQAYKKKDWKKYLIMHMKPFRLEAFIKIEHLLNDKEYWNLLGNLWISSEGHSKVKNVWLDLFTSNRAHKEHFMIVHDRKEFEKLPEEFEIHRGCYENDQGLSYSLDRKIAEWFATRWERELKVKGMVKSKIVKKSDCFAYLKSGEEEEIIYLGDY